MPTIAQLIGIRIRYHRQENNLTQEELAEKADLHNTYIGQVERGEKKLTVSSLERILIALDVSFTEFFSGVEQDTKLLQLSQNAASQCYYLISHYPPEKQKQLLKILTDITNLTS